MNIFLKWYANFNIGITVILVNCKSRKGHNLEKKWQYSQVLRFGSWRWTSVQFQRIWKYLRIIFTKWSTELSTHAQRFGSFGLTSVQKFKAIFQEQMKIFNVVHHGKHFGKNISRFCRMLVPLPSFSKL